MSNERKSSGNLALQGGILAATSLLVRLIGFCYRIPLVNLLGVEGMGYYSSSFEIYSYLLVLSSYALPSALSKIISNRLTLKRYKEAEQIFRAAMLMGVTIGLVTSSLLYFQADNIARLVGNEGSALAMKALAPSLLIFSVMAIIRGYFQGHNTMVPTAVSQVIEQVFNAIFSLSLAFVLMRQSIVYGAAGGTLGTAIGAFFGLAFLVVIYAMVRPRFKARVRKDTHEEGMPSLFTSWQIIFMTAVPMLIGSSVYNLSNIVDMVMFQRALLHHGYAPKFVSEQYGLLSSKYRLILTLPISIASALAAASIPSMAASMARKAYNEVQVKAAMALKMVLIISIPSAFGLGVLAKPVLWMLFGTETLELSALLMRIGAVSIVFFSVSSISIGILQGINKINIPVYHSLIGVLSKAVLLYVLLYVFDTGLIGAVVANVLFSMFVAGTNFNSIRRAIHLKLNYRQALGAPLIAGLIMSGSVLVIYELVIMLLSNSWTGNTFATVTAIMVAIPVYFLSLIWMDGLEETDIKMLPMGTRAVDVLKRIGLMGK